MPTPTILLDGHVLAARRAPPHAERAGAVLAVRGRPPALHLIGFGADGRMPGSIARKLRTGEAAGVVVTAAILAPDATTADVLAAMRATPRAADGLFLEFPFPGGVDEGALIDALPVELDVDIMTQTRIDAFFAGDGPPPATVSAALALLDEGDVDVTGRRGVVVAEPMPFTEMFAQALRRLGAEVDLLDPAHAAEARAAELVVSCAGSPGLLRSDALAPGAVVIDAGYFNPGGRGDVDTTPGFDHLAALAPVPGGIGPATIAMLIERAIDFAEGNR